MVWDVPIDVMPAKSISAPFISWQSERKLHWGLASSTKYRPFVGSLSKGSHTMRCCGCVQLQILRLLQYPGTKENETYPVL